MVIGLRNSFTYDNFHTLTKKRKKEKNKDLVN